MSDSKFRVRPADQPDSPGLLVEQIYSWDRGFMQHIDANSSGPKASIRNLIFEVFAALPLADRIIMVRGRGPIFVLVRSEGHWYDVEHHRCVLERVAASGS